ncbi:hypothetical protein [Holospora curviuscula]|uniref:Uncharacterized protein n=1 Tax=Holospora curviuscula TaxID=1082868 RepID=A0A2S5RGD5_9PROT|nr:hypothetical protein [Holospora curviuscula]PPE06357.1 hypothetical protein HCUR_00144 [Holospora curviuscula]
MVLTHIPKKSGGVMDTVAFRKSKAMQKMIKDAGHTLPSALFF